MGKSRRGEGRKGGEWRKMYSTKKHFKTFLKKDFTFSLQFPEELIYVAFGLQTIFTLDFFLSKHFNKYVQIDCSN